MMNKNAPRENLDWTELKKIDSVMIIYPIWEMCKSSHLLLSILLQLADSSKLTNAGYLKLGNKMRTIFTDGTRYRRSESQLVCLLSCLLACLLVLPSSPIGQVSQYLHSDWSRHRLGSNWALPDLGDNSYWERTHRHIKVVLW